MAPSSNRHNSSALLHYDCSSEPLSGHTKGRRLPSEAERAMNRLYGSADEEAVSQSAIEALARETEHSIDEVRDIYEGEFARLRDGARVHDYLVLFASRRTRDRLVH